MKLPIGIDSWILISTVIFTSVFLLLASATANHSAIESCMCLKQEQDLKRF